MSGHVLPRALIAIAASFAMAAVAPSVLSQPHQRPPGDRPSGPPESRPQPPQFQPQMSQPQPPGLDQPPQQQQLPPRQPPPSERQPGQGPPPPEPQIAPQPQQPRTPYAIQEGWPLQRPPRSVVVNPPPIPPRVPPKVYLPPVPFGGPVGEDRAYRDYRYYDYPRPYVRDRLTWLDGRTLYREEGWVEFTLDCNARGEQLWFEIRDGRVRLDWAEVVFEDGESQVVDFSERSIGPGVYSMLRFRPGRRVDHVRIVAESATRRVHLVLRMVL